NMAEKRSLHDRSLVRTDRHRAGVRPVDAFRSKQARSLERNGGPRATVGHHRFAETGLDRARLDHARYDGARYGMARHHRARQLAERKAEAQTQAEATQAGAPQAAALES